MNPACRSSHRPTGQSFGQWPVGLGGTFGWVRDRDATAPERPNAVAAQENITGTNSASGPIALDIGAAGGTHSLLDEPIDVGTQVARKQSNDNRNFQWNADFIWSRAKHTWEFGTAVHFLPTLHLRDDKVIGALGALVAQMDADIGASIVIPAADRPPTCSPTTPTNCIRTTDIQQWDRLYAGTLGMVDLISVLAVRDGNFNPCRSVLNWNPIPSCGPRKCTFRMFGV